MNLEDRLKIQELIARFANSFDVKDWRALEACFTEVLFTDYSDLRGTPPQNVSASEYARSRRESLDHLKLHHLVSNYEIEFGNPNSAVCRASMIVWRKSEEEEFTSHCYYIFQLTKLDSDWKISGITQKVLWNEGTSSIHQGAKDN
ncbi:MAG TPA: nuclear transport factor 2 family protein [Anaerolineales bacterium]|nr:nuclear transport factor 2 family protein [Anaerolineales bacterium]